MCHTWPLYQLTPSTSTEQLSLSTALLFFNSFWHLRKNWQLIYITVNQERIKTESKHDYKNRFSISHVVHEVSAQIPSAVVPSYGLLLFLTATVVQSIRITYCCDRATCRLSRIQGCKRPRFFKTIFRFLGFNLQMPDTKLRPKSTMKNKDKCSEQRFGHVNATNRNSIRISFVLN